MSWNQGGGPWGGGGPGPWGSGGGGRGFQPPNFEDTLRRLQNFLRRILPGGTGPGGPGIWVVGFAIVVLLWLASGIYRVEPDEEGIVLRFGAYAGKTAPGLNYHWPWPIEEAMTPTVTRVNRIEIGFRAGAPGRSGSVTDVPEESLMLTGDENIVDVNFTVFWLVKDWPYFLFNIRDPEVTVKAAAESSMREVIGHTQIASALAEGRAKIESETRDLLQSILNSYHAGIDITQVQLQRVDPPAEVIDSFRDVQAALADRERLRNEAEAYRNDIIPRARGDAVRIQQEAEAYRQEIVARSQGDAARFLSVYHAFKSAQDVTLQRLYLETMEDVLKNSTKVIIDKSAEGGSGVLPYLPLPALGGGTAAPSPKPAAPAAGAANSTDSDTAPLTVPSPPAPPLLRGGQ